MYTDPQGAIELPEAKDAEVEISIDPGVVGGVGLGGAELGEGAAAVTEEEEEEHLGLYLASAYTFLYTNP